MDRIKNKQQAYSMAQTAIADLKSAVYIILETADDDGMTNADIGRTLGIYQGHIKHEGHIPRTLLGIMEHEGVVEQVEDTKKWKLKFK
ncbi:hypothetical protein PQ469_00110 [Mucilaginibacter sp. KACC 22773]|uniref:hypothetical protein n=1 Tax=Mucilaginibacter sp. KACC 22773 TaxID=3025671 RepID=UPI00236738B8|nr:hypothetical protein [Mucilaginibacter sp. KACC 22773]WDF78408.1 hypothetical protein PQ469_00110 [Mucilaginibacter sp. KACC 22773]